MKYLITLLFLTKLLNASMLLGANSYCIENFYTKAGSFYYLRSDNNTWYTTTIDTWTATVMPNYIYDPLTTQCNPNLSYILGMLETEYNFLLGLMGVIIGGVFMFFLVNAFISVGGRK